MFWVVDHGSSHRGQGSARWLQNQWPALTLVHLPIHASGSIDWKSPLSVIQRKILTPNDFGSWPRPSRAAGFQDYYEQITTPCQWKSTKSDLTLLLKRIAAHEPTSALAA